PASRLFLLSHSGRVGSLTAELALLSGWLKGETPPNVGRYRYETPLLAGVTTEGSLVLHAAVASAEVFVESGSASITELRPDGSGTRTIVGKTGQFFSRSAGKTLTSPRPTSSFVEMMPSPFRDTLPARLSRFIGKPVEARRNHEVSYSEIYPWLTAPFRWRKEFVSRFQARLSDPEFRRELEDHLPDHPEWDQILHPKQHTLPERPASGDSSQPPERRDSK